ncbi:hypothetical protein PsorP6_004150 [Peronosclerospora sorghi]|uniref:Uncharacterized protein n=1 Tax=Peronosclerospora sorghi TaxID=230839 RepID=A0ACC0VJY7_9STRA|nr:hypothetical protein PsorP6_004150 [Peronosclerospora sorghi]
MNSEEDTAPLQEAERAHREATPFANVVPVRHTRRCNGRTICSCILRVESAYFHKKLVENAAKKRRVNDSAAAIATTTTTMTRKYQKVTNIQGLQLDIKSHIASFLTPLALGRLGMTSKKFKSDVNTMAKQATETFLAHASMDKLLTQQKPKATESWSQFMHNQLTCIHKLFVYYTGYKTGPMRQQFPHWAFGVVHVDPNAPHCRILPNTWTFHGHHPWLRRRGNGKDGEWLLSKKYTGTNAPSDFVVHVKSWASTLRPGSMLAVAHVSFHSKRDVLTVGVFHDDTSSIKMLDRKSQRGGKPKLGIYGEVTVNKTPLSSTIRKLKLISKFIQTIYSSILRHTRCMLLTYAKSLEQYVDHVRAETERSSIVISTKGIRCCSASSL